MVVEKKPEGNIFKWGKLHQNEQYCSASDMYILETRKLSKF